LINGVTPTLFDPQGIVNPKMVCTVVLRWLKIAETDWDYNTSLKKAQEIGLTNGANVSGATIARGDMALVIRRGMDQKAKSTTTYTPTPTPTPTPVPTTTPGAGTTMTIEEMKAEVLRLVNIERVNAGVPELEVSDALMTSAQLKADDMRINNYYGHNSPTYGTPSAMIKKYAGVGGAENYAYGQTTASWAVKWWMNSSLHKAAMLNTKYTHIGIGIVEDPISGYVWVQHFATIK
jgi:uncharacterized protein YkwD